MCYLTLSIFAFEPFCILEQNIGSFLHCKFMKILRHFLHLLKKNAIQGIFLTFKYEATFLTVIYLAIHTHVNNYRLLEHTSLNIYQ